MPPRVLVICPDPMRRQLLTKRARKRLPSATVESCVGLFDGMPRIWASHPDIVVVADLPLYGRNGWRLPELRHAAGDALVIAVGDRDGTLGRAVGADVVRANLQVRGLRGIGFARAAGRAGAQAG